jgi:hypothetical protein
MDRHGRQFLTRARLAGNQHGGFAVRHFGDGAKQIFHRGTGTHYFIVPRERICFRIEYHHAVLMTDGVDHAVELIRNGDKP